MRRSAARRKRPKPAQTYFADECLGRRVANALAAAGHQIVSAIDYASGQLDDVWLPDIGAKRWVLLTKDKKVRRRPIEVQAILNANVRAFIVTADNVSANELTALLLKSMRKIARICVRRGPFVFNITRFGTFSEIAPRVLRRRAK